MLLALAVRNVNFFQTEQARELKSLAKAKKQQNGVCEQIGERGGESGEQQHGDKRMFGGVFRGVERQIGEPAEGHRSPGGAQGLACSVQQGNEKGHVGVEATAFR